LRHERLAHDRNVFWGAVQVALREFPLRLYLRRMVLSGAALRLGQASLQRCDSFRRARRCRRRRRVARVVLPPLRLEAGAYTPSLHSST